MPVYVYLKAKDADPIRTMADVGTELVDEDVLDFLEVAAKARGFYCARSGNQITVVVPLGRETEWKLAAGHIPSLEVP